MSAWLFNVYMDAVMEEVKIGMGKRGESGYYLVFEDNLVLCGESEEDLRAMMGRLVEVCRRRKLKVNVGKSKVRVLNGEERLECEVQVDGIRLRYVSKFKYVECVFDVSGTDGAECSRKVVDAMRFLVNARDLQLECARVLHKTLLVPVLMYGSEKMLWKENERSGIRAVNLRGFLGIRKRDRVLNARIRELCGVTKGVDERIDEGVVRWSGHVERRENDKIAKRVYVKECAVVAQWVGHGRDGFIS